MKSKKALGFAAIVVTTIILITFLAMTPLYGKIIEITGEGVIDKICHASALANSFGKTAGAERFSLKCPRKLTTLTFKGEGKGVAIETTVNVDDQEKTFKASYSSYSLAKKNIEKYNFEEKNEDMFVINHAIAEQIKQCWNNLGNGELNLFSEWWAPLEVGAEEPDSWWSKVKGTLPRIREAPTYCVVCSRIKFDEKAQEFIEKTNQGEVTSLEEWMKKTPVPASKPPISYFEYLLDDVHVGLFEGQNFKYKADKPYAVVFTRINVLRSSEFLKDIIDIFPGYSEEDHPEAVDAIYLMPYDELKDTCTVLSN